MITPQGFCYSVLSWKCSKDIHLPTFNKSRTIPSLQFFAPTYLWFDPIDSKSTEFNSRQVYYLPNFSLQLLLFFMFCQEFVSSFLSYIVSLSLQIVWIKLGVLQFCQKVCENHKIVWQNCNCRGNHIHSWSLCWIQKNLLFSMHK